MTNATFIHRTAPLQAQIKACREMEFHQMANALEGVAKKIERGVIRTVAQLDKELDRLKENEAW